MISANNVNIMSDHDYCQNNNKLLKENILSENHYTLAKVRQISDTTNQQLPQSSSQHIQVETVNDLETDLDGVWQTVPSNKRSRLNENNQQCKKPRQLVTTETENRYDALSETNDMEEADISDRQEVKPPPIFIPDISNIKKMITSIESVISKDDYTYKLLNENKVKVCPLSISSYRTLIHKLTELKVTFHTFQLKQDRAFRVVLKNMHYSTDIKMSIEEQGFRVRNITNIREFKTKSPLSMFFSIRNLLETIQTYFLLSILQSTPVLGLTVRHGH